MLGDYLTLLVAVLGYIYPVYLCFKVSGYPRSPPRRRRSRLAPVPSFPLFAESHPESAVVLTCSPTSDPSGAGEAQA